MTQTSSQPTKKRFTFQSLVLLLIPIVLLAGVIALFLTTGGGLNLDSAAPVESLDIERYTLEPNKITLHIRNTGPGQITIASIIINDAVMPFTVSPSADVPRLAQADIHTLRGPHPRPRRVRGRPPAVASDRDARAVDRLQQALRQIAGVAHQTAKSCGAGQGALLRDDFQLPTLPETAANMHGEV